MFSDSHTPLQKWFYAIYLNTSLKKGISSIQLAKYLDITQKTAWFMLQRIRYSVEKAGREDLLGNIVEADETYVGGKKHDGMRGRGASGKTPVVGIAERKGEIRLAVTQDTTTQTLEKVITDNVTPGSIVMTDEYRPTITLPSLAMSTTASTTLAKSLSSAKITPTLLKARGAT
jgi:hypothetical protein